MIDHPQDLNYARRMYGNFRPSIEERRAQKMGKRRKLRPGEDPEYLARIRQLPCATCSETRDIQAHHLRFLELRAMGHKPKDQYAIPQCWLCHNEAHRYGSREEEAFYWDEQGLKVALLQVELYKRRNSVADMRIVREFFMKEQIDELARRMRHTGAKVALRRKTQRSR